MNNVQCTPLSLAVPSTACYYEHGRNSSVAVAVVQIPSETCGLMAKNALGFEDVRIHSPFLQLPPV